VKSIFDVVIKVVGHQAPQKQEKKKKPHRDVLVDFFIS